MKQVNGKLLLIGSGIIMVILISGCIDAGNLEIVSIEFDSGCLPTDDMFSCAEPRHFDITIKNTGGEEIDTRNLNFTLCIGIDREYCEGTEEYSRWNSESLLENKTIPAGETVEVRLAAFPISYGIRENETMDEVTRRMYCGDYTFRIEDLINNEVYEKEYRCS